MVETSQNFPESLLWDLLSFQVGPASKWVLGLLELVNPVHVSDKVRSPISVDTLFLHNIQICVRFPGHVTTFVERSESESWKMCAVGKHFCVLWIICELLQPFRNLSQTVIRFSIAVLFLFWFWVLGGWSAPVSWSWSVTSLQGWTCWRQTCNVMSKTNCYQNGRTTREQQAVRHCPFCI